MKHGQIAEYRDVTGDQLSKVTVLDTGTDAPIVGRVSRKTFTLKSHSVGFECAGSMARWQGYPVYSVTFEQGGATHGRRFINQGEAQDLFDKWTGRDVEINAQIIRDEVRKES